MQKYILKINEVKSEIIEYLGYIIDNCYVFIFSDETLFYLPVDKYNLFIKNDKLKLI
jgi:hypothetical protein